jgi:hypothetical protein
VVAARHRSRWPWLLAAVALLGPASARADGAFPDGQTILAPRDLAGTLVLATNFGVVRTSDGGTSWIWTCEQAANNFGRLYQMAPGPGHRLFAIAGGKLIYSDDDACGWQVGGGTLAGTSCQDAFVDPNDGAHVLAVTLTFGDGGPSYVVVESRDGGATFGPPIFAAAAGDLITGVEIAAGHPRSLDLALAHGSQLTPALARSADGGATWQTADLGAALGTDQIRILAVDPADPDRVYLRALGPNGDALAVFAAGADPALQVSLSFPNGQMTAFVKTAAGPILVAGNRAGAPVLQRSGDGGATFTAVAGPPAILSMAERAGVVYAATDTTSEPFAEAASTDLGRTWTPGLKFAQIDAIAPCASAACQADCAARAAQGQWPAAMCAAAPSDPPTGDPDGGPPPPLLDAAAGPDAAGPDAARPDAAPPPDAAPTRDAGAARPPLDGGTRLDAGDVVRPPAGSGCSCAVDSRAGPRPGPARLFAWAGLLTALSRGARRPGRGRRRTRR